MIRKCEKKDFDKILSIVNDAAQAYKNKIPKEGWKEPYMPKEELAHEMEDRVEFYCWEENGELLGVMGIQDKNDVCLVRHAYVRKKQQGKGIGGKLIEYLKTLSKLPMLVGTWRGAYWAVSFYEKHGFRLVGKKEKDFLLRKYWSIPESQVEASVVLANGIWFCKNNNE